MSLMLRIIHYSSPFVDLAVLGLQNSLFLLIARNAINDIQFSDLNIVHLSFCESKQKYPKCSISFQNSK